MIKAFNFSGKSGYKHVRGFLGDILRLLFREL